MFPLREHKQVEERHSVVEYFFKDSELKKLLAQQLSLIGDLERIISKAAVGRIGPREVVQLKVALNAIEPIKDAFLESDNINLKKLGKQLNPCPIIRDKIEKELKPDPPALLNKGGYINKCVNSELDELREIAYSGKDYLIQLQHRESERTGIPSLKVAFNNVLAIILRLEIHTRIRFR